MPLRSGVAMGIDFAFDPAHIDLLSQAFLSGSMISLAYFVWQVFRSTPGGRARGLDDRAARQRAAASVRDDRSG